MATAETSPDNGVTEEEVEEQPVVTTEKKLDFNQLALFGFTDIPTSHRPQAQAAVVDTGGGKKGAGAGAVRRKSRNQTVVYGADSDDDLGDADYQQDDYVPGVAASVEGDDEGNEGEDEDEGGRYDYSETLADLDEDLWEDDEEEEEETDSEAREEAELEAEMEAELERERIREQRLQEIMKKKEELIERYLKVARVMINHRKKNIYLQDYLYHLASRKGLLRGDPSVRLGEGSITSTKAAKAQQNRLQQKKATMTARFARFLRKTGHFYDPEQEQHHEHVHHHHHHHHHHHRQRHHHHGHHDDGFRNRLSRHYNFTSHLLHHSHHHKKAHNVKPLPSTTVTKHDPSKACMFGKDCRGESQKMQNKLHKKLQKKKKQEAEVRHSTADSTQQKLQNRQKPLSLMEKLELKAAATIKKLQKGPTDALEAFEKHRCKLAKKKQQIKITKLLERQFAGTSLIEQERHHLIAFVEHSVTQQNLARKRALRKKKQQQEKENKSMGIKHMNHQWFRSLDRIRELRIKKAKLEQEHRLELMKKVKHWHVWEKRDLTALEGVYDFIVNMSSRVGMSRRETEHFSVSLEQFRKQLHTLYGTLITQLSKLFKARAMLHMAHRRVKDNASVASQMKGFTIADYERMVIENEESHQKLKEKQGHLVQQHEKLKEYVKNVSTIHARKQRTWGALRAGRHDLKQLWELCRHEKENLIKKTRELRRMGKQHKRFFTQVSVLGNKNCLKDFHRVHDKAQQLEDKQRKLHTQVQATETILHVLKVKVADAQKRIEEDEREKQEKALINDIAFYKDTMKQRMNPTLPNTIYDANIMSRKSMERVYSKEGDGTRCGSYKRKTKDKLPLIPKK